MNKKNDNHNRIKIEEKLKQIEKGLQLLISIMLLVEYPQMYS